MNELMIEAIWIKHGYIKRSRRRKGRKQEGMGEDERRCEKKGGDKEDKVNMRYRETE